MTVEQLTRLAELAALAAGYFVASNPSYARRFADAALAADKLAADKLAADLSVELQATRAGRERSQVRGHRPGGPKVA